MTVVADASAVVVAVASTTLQGLPARRVLRSGALAPHVIDAEVGSSLRRLVLRGELGPVAARRSLVLAHRLVGPRLPHGPLLRRAWELRDNLSFYDALYVAAAESLGLPLLTADARLAAAPGPRCDVEVI